VFTSRIHEFLIIDKTFAGLQRYHPGIHVCTLYSCIFHFKLRTEPFTFTQVKVEVCYKVSSHIVFMEGLKLNLYIYFKIPFSSYITRSILVKHDGRIRIDLSENESK